MSWVIIVILVIAGIAAYVFSGKNQRPAQEGAANQQSVSSAPQSINPPLSFDSTIDTTLRTILSSEQAAVLASVDCTKITSDQYIKLGDAVMGSLAGDETHHSAIENAMGGEEGAMAVEAHTKLGQLYLNCPEKTVPQNSVAGSMTGGMMDKNGTMTKDTMGLTHTMDMKRMSDMDVLAIKRNANIGEYLTDTQGMTLYTFANDTSGVSNCTGQCLAAWPAYSAMKVSKDLSMMYQNLSVITRSDGAMQYAWKGMPLYYFAQDKMAGDALGDDLKGLWGAAKP